jgi:pyrimidine-nucleoside phosphorylase
MDMLQLIERKRDGAAHDAQEIAWLVGGIVDETIPDYQLSAWLMAVVWRGMTAQETAALTEAMARSGETLDLSSLPGTTVDKHSTGGVGDKTSLVVCPLVTACGLTVAKMSGRGLGHTGGTLDKLESIPGLTVDLSIERFMRQARDVGLVIAGASADLAPADKRLYALRDVTGTVPSLPLIASSIMSKKIAAGSSAIALDVKVGAGAFMRDRSDARTLANAMVDLGARAGRRTAALLTDMDQPLGMRVGNALEVTEAIETLSGQGPPDFLELCMAVAGVMLVAAGHAEDLQGTQSELQKALDSGRARDVFAEMVEAQGGNGRVVDDQSLLPRAHANAVLTAPRSGYIGRVDALAVGHACVATGAGRRHKGAEVDPSAGVVLRVKAGDLVRSGQELAVVHAADSAAAAAGLELLRGAFFIQDESPPASPVVLEIIDPG